jgi:hypothetical protein
MGRLSASGQSRPFMQWELGCRSFPQSQPDKAFLGFDSSPCACRLSHNYIRTQSEMTEIFPKPHTECASNPMLDRQGYVTPLSPTTPFRPMGAFVAWTNRHVNTGISAQLFPPFSRFRQPFLFVQLKCLEMNLTVLVRLRSLPFTHTHRTSC